MPYKGPLHNQSEIRFDCLGLRVLLCWSQLQSFRIGVATTAAEWGIEDSVIKMLGRWESSAYQLYVRASQQALAAISRRLVTLD
jgi:hypothetical protein